jgi:hypothetical protein
MKDTRALLNTLYQTKVALREKGVMRSERFTGELGEWLVEVAYQAKRALATSQRGWDVQAEVDGKASLLQVKTHAKGKRNGARWTEVRPDCIGQFDRLVIVVLSDDYFIKQWFDIPRNAVQSMLTQSGKSWIVKWDDALAYEKDIQMLPGGKDLVDFNSR